VLQLPQLATIITAPCITTGTLPFDGLGSAVKI